MDRGFILSHLDDFSAEQLFAFICQEIVTLEEMKATGNLDNTKRRAITNLQHARDAEDDHAWNAARYTEQGCRDYLAHYPAGRHVVGAGQKIDELEQQRRNEIAEKQRIFDKISINPNAYPPAEIRKYLNDGNLSRSSLLDIGIPDHIIDRLNTSHDSPPTWELGKTPESIPDGYTEVYFWGIRGSGKTTALAAVLSTANRLGLLEIAQGPGFNYMLQLKNLFNDKIATLPAATSNEDTQYLPFTLKKPTERNYRSVSLIELSGEIFQCFLYKNTNKTLDTKHEETFNSLLRFLQGNNRKLHFFFIDYDKENIKDRDGFTQADFLSSASIFFNNPKYNLFGKTTDAIYVIITKSDLMPGNKESWVGQVSQYLNTNNFTAFVNALKAKCQTYSINNGRLLATPFSLGKVYFTEICDFDDTTAKNIIDILMRRIPSSRTSILDVFNT